MSKRFIFPFTDVCPLVAGPDDFWCFIHMLAGYYFVAAGEWVSFRISV